MSIATKMSILLCLFATLPFANTLANDGAGTELSPKFRWLTKGNDGTVFATVKAAFAEELKPDVPAKVAPTAPYLYKYISRVGALGSSAIVLIGERDSVTDSSGDFFIAYNFNLRTRGKSTIQSTDTFWDWKVYELVRFERSEFPDIVFTYYDCTECESTYLLGAYRYDSQTGKWRIRKWGPKDDSIMIGSSIQFGDEGTLGYDCAFRIGGFDANGLNQIATWCRETVMETHKSRDTTSFYSANAEPQDSTITRPQQVQQVHRFICETNGSSKLCRSR